VHPVEAVLEARARLEPGQVGSGAEALAVSAGALAIVPALDAEDVGAVGHGRAAMRARAVERQLVAPADALPRERARG